MRCKLVNPYIWVSNKHLDLSYHILSTAKTLYCLTEEFLHSFLKIGCMLPTIYTKILVFLILIYFTNVSLLYGFVHQDIKIECIPHMSSTTQCDGLVFSYCKFPG